jgi:hypothetical protein
MPVGSQTNTVVLLVPVAASVDWGREPKPKPWRHHKPSREAWNKRRQAIPRHQVDREAIRQLLHRTRETLKDAKPQIQAMLAA